MKKDEEKDRDYDLSQIGDAPVVSFIGDEEDSAAAVQSEEDAQEVSKVEEEKPQSADEAGSAKTDGDSEDESEEEIEDIEEEEAQEGSLSENSAWMLAARFSDMAAKLIKGEWNEEELSHLVNIDNARSEIEAAYQRGLAEGRNEIIEERLVTIAPGVPDLCGAPPASSSRRNASIFDLAGMAR